MTATTRLTGPVASAAGSRPPRPRPRWTVSEPPPAQVIATLAQSLQLSLVAAQLLAARGHVEPERAKLFLRPKLERLNDPHSMGGMDVAVERLARAVKSGEMVLVHGDYDVDGMCSTTLLVRLLREGGGCVTPFIPSRLTDGYDLTMAGVRAAQSCGATVVVTCDCGTSALEPIAALTALGIDTIVTDHHLPGGPLPDCLAVLNPRAPGNGYPDADLAAVGVAFQLARALAPAIGVSEGFVFRMLDLVALATIADVAPLRGENRIFARFGLRMMAETENAGLRALIRASGLEGKPMTAGRVGYILAPRLNAVGRLGNALRGVELLLCTSEASANPIARELEELNRKRQEMDKETLAAARLLLDTLDFGATRGLVLAAEGWHPGVIGIVASRVVEETGRPAVLIALQNGEGKGSGRSISAFDLHSALTECKDLFVRYGGHRVAAGVTMREERVAEFAERFNAVACARLTDNDLVPELRVDLALDLSEATEELGSILRHFEPFGIGNPGPLFASRGVELLAAPKRIGTDGIKLRLAAGAGELEAIGWGMAPLAEGLRGGETLDVAWRLERDEYQGRDRLQAKLADLVRPRTER